MHYNNLSIFYLLSGEFQLKFQIYVFKRTRKSTTEEVDEDVNESFCIIKSGFFDAWSLWYLM